MNGIGGRTIEEAKSRIGYAEFLDWVAYRQKRGSLHPGMRIERGAALLASLHANTHSKCGGFTLDDFMPHLDQAPLSLEAAMESWS